MKKTLTGVTTIATLLSGLAIASAQTYPPRGGMGPYGEGSAGMQQDRDYDIPADAYDARSTTGLSSKDVSQGQPNEQNQQEERDVFGRTGGNTQHPAR
jgi:hypothetical protein